MYVQTNKSAIIYYMSSESVPVLSCKENVNKCNFGVLYMLSTCDFQWKASTA